MSTNESDELLWELSADAREAETSRDASGDPITEATLRAYRSGELQAGDVERVERELGRDAALRRRLATLGGVAPQVTARLRADVLRADEPRTDEPRAEEHRAEEHRADAPSADAHGPSDARRRPPGLRLAAALAVATVGAAAIYFGLLGGGRATAPDPMSYEVRVEGESEVRSIADGERVYPDTQLRIVVEPRSIGRSDVAFALYRRDGDAVVRIPDGAFELQVHRGAALFVGEAVALLGETPGERQLFVVIASADDLPAARIEVGKGGDAESALSDRGRHAVRPLRLWMNPPLETSRSLDADEDTTVSEGAPPVEGSSVSESAGELAGEMEGEVP